MAELTQEVIRVFQQLMENEILQERRPGQLRMTEAVARAIDQKSHVVVSAGTGIGKTWAYLVPAVLSGKRVVIATATRSLQEQLAKRDLPQVCDALGASITWALLKGRSNYVCRQVLAEHPPDTDNQTDNDASRLIEWARATNSGDRDELTWEPTTELWRTVSVRSDECPGKERCPSGAGCFAEKARELAAVSDIVITNQHTYAAGVFASQQILPDHDIVIFDEAHQVDEVFRQAGSTRVDPVGLAALVNKSRVADQIAAQELNHGLTALGATLRPLVGTWLIELPFSVSESLGNVGNAMRAYAAKARSLAKAEPAAHSWLRLAQSCSLAAEHMALAGGTGRSIWIEGTSGRPVLRSAAVQLDLLPAFRAPIARSAILASATIGTEVPEELGFGADQYVFLHADSNFEYSRKALLYCATHLPDPRSSTWSAAVHEELATLIQAVGGRTLALFTSWRALEAAVAAVVPQLDVEVLIQGTLGKRELLAKFQSVRESCLFGTIGLAQGIDIPGDSLRLVTIDKIPFPPIGDSYLAARRAQKGPRGFTEVDLRHAKTILAQAAGRLIRTSSDEGAFAVLDPRLASARYRWDLIRALPPMRRTKERQEVIDFLLSMHDPESGRIVSATHGAP